MGLLAVRVGRSGVLFGLVVLAGFVVVGRLKVVMGGRVVFGGGLMVVIGGRVFLVRHGRQLPEVVKVGHRL